MSILLLIGVTVCVEILDAQYILLLSIDILINLLFKKWIYYCLILKHQMNIPLHIKFKPSQTQKLIRLYSRKAMTLKVIHF